LRSSSPAARALPIRSIGNNAMRRMTNNREHLSLAIGRRRRLSPVNTQAVRTPKTSPSRSPVPRPQTIAWGSSSCSRHQPPCAGSSPEQELPKLDASLANVVRMTSFDSDAWEVPRGVPQVQPEFPMWGGSKLDLPDLTPQSIEGSPVTSRSRTSTVTTEDLTCRLLQTPATSRSVSSSSPATKDGEGSPDPSSKARTSSKRTRFASSVSSQTSSRSSLLKPNSCKESFADSSRHDALGAAMDGPQGGVTSITNEFRAILCKKYGNLTRAFQALQCAASTMTSNVAAAQKASRTGSTRLTYAQFEWCVVSFLRCGDRRMARRLFAAFDRDKREEIGLVELAASPVRSKGLMSLVEFRRRLLERHSSLTHAFREFEDWLDVHFVATDQQQRGKRSSRTMRLAEFIAVTALFGLEEQQATHFFRLMDRDSNGELSFDEFLAAVTEMPRSVLLYDFRQRLLARHPSIKSAFRELSTSMAGARMNQTDFERTVSAWGVADVEAAELFRLMDGDKSGDVSAQELMDCLREEAPHTTYEEFWARFAKEWPEVVRAAHKGGNAGREFVGVLLADLLPQRLTEVSCPLRRRAIFAALDLIGESGGKAALSYQESSRTVSVLNFEAFNALVVQLDISPGDATNIFRRFFSGRVGGSPGQDPMDIEVEADADEGGFHVEDFIELVQLWVESPIRPPLDGSGAIAHQSGAEAIQQVVAPTRAAITALKAELSPSHVAGVVDAEGREQLNTRVQARRPRNLPKMPWRAHHRTGDRALVAIAA